ncbi:MAG: MlaE family ABC transporter permease [Desulfobulbus sp.]|jgi:phospholipid/cholesterol/gamma-HCH transport system permease protein
MATIPSVPSVSCEHAGEQVLIIHLAGPWTIHDEPPDPAPLLAKIAPPLTTIRFVVDRLDDWDTRLLILLTAIRNSAAAQGIAVDTEGLPPGARRLMRLAEAVPGKTTYSTPKRDSLVTLIGKKTLELGEKFRELALFTGELVLSLGALLTGKPVFKSRDLFFFMQVCGIESLPIVALISFLVGVILSFVGAIQLQMFGAQIYVANLVGLGMVIEMGALMSGIIIAGRIGASYAAQLGTMQVNEEIDALRTMGISPVGFLVLPRVLALALMMPLICVYADVLGILGGSFIGVTMLDLSLPEFLGQVQKSVSLNQCGQGIFKSSVFGVLIGFAGCLRGMQCGRSALAVGEATTSAVVTSILLIVISDSLITYFLFR